MKFSLVSTVFNEGDRLHQTIEDFENQSLLPDEIVITDAGSTDGTFERLNDWKKESRISIVILQKERCNVAEGRNLAISQATNDIIVSTDFGCRFHPEWLKSLVTPFKDKKVKVVGGAFSVLEEEIVSEPAKANFLLTNGYQVTLDDQFIPSSRSIAYYKNVWKEVGGYCEWLTLAADDLVFGKAVKAKGYAFHLVPEPYVYWMRHEKAAAYGKEAFRYGLGDGEARVNKRNTMVVLAETALRYSFFPILIGAAYLTQTVNPLFVVVPLPFVVGFRPYKNAFTKWLKIRSAKYNLKIFVEALRLIELTRFNYLKGYYKGYFEASEEQKEGARKLKLILN